VGLTKKKAKEKKHDTGNHEKKMDPAENQKMNWGEFPGIWPEGRHVFGAGETMCKGSMGLRPRRLRCAVRVRDPSLEGGEPGGDPSAGSTGPRRAAGSGERLGGKQGSDI